MKCSRKFKQEAMRIAAPWWKRNTYPDFDEMDRFTITDGLAALLRAGATKAAAQEITGIQTHLANMDHFIAKGRAADAAEMGIKAGASFFKLIADTAARNKEGGTTPGFAVFNGKDVDLWDWVRRVFSPHPSWPVIKIFLTARDNFHRDLRNNNRPFLAESTVVRRFKTRVREWKEPPPQGT
jgi:hypothetical protein